MSSDADDPRVSIANTCNSTGVIRYELCPPHTVNSGLTERQRDETPEPGLLHDGCKLIKVESE